MSPAKPRSTWSLIARMRLGLLLLFIPVLLLGSIYYLHMERTLRQEQENNLMARNTQYLHTLIEPYLEELERQFTLIYQQVNYQDFSEPQIHNRARYLQSWRAYQAVMELDYIYVGTEQRQMLIYPSWQADDQFDPRTRPWYQLASRHPDQLVWTDPYYDYTMGTLTMALARTIQDPAGKRVGVLSLDTQLTPLANWLNKRDRVDHQEEGYQILLNQDGVVLAHPDRNLVFKPLPQIGWQVRMSAPQGFFLDETSDLMVAYHHIPRLNWILLSVAPTAHMQQVTNSVSINVQLMIGFAFVLYLLLALLWSRYFRRMLGEITLLIRASRIGNISPQSNSRMLELANVYEEMAAASQDFAQIRRQANQDKLTTLYNRRFFDECLQQQLDAGKQIGLVMFDLDDFKRVNDTYGHQTGDVVLRRVSKLGLSLFHEWGWFCRYGGEELVLIFRLDEHTDVFASLLEAFRHGVELLEWREPELRITLSGGVAISHTGVSARALVEQADNEVYRAKREGKNRVCFPLASADHSAPSPTGDG
ncbi:diguanylate cyclase [Aeromonas enteropelogenes]|uniref:sensor domain-containing diguanylate cyclase n=1 Tax=Aeromonas enteropelogenes TaxID=29489 RepID=UPI003989A101